MERKEDKVERPVRRTIDGHELHLYLYLSKISVYLYIHAAIITLHIQMMWKNNERKKCE